MDLLVIPPNGRPLQHFADPLGIYDNVSPETVRTWMAREEGALGVMLYDVGCAAADNARERADHVRFIITALTGVEGIEVSVPAPMVTIPRGPNGDTKQPPAIHRIWNCPEYVKEFLLDNKLFNTERWTLICVPLYPVAPSYLFGLRNVTCTQEGLVRQHVIAVWTGSLLIDILMPILAKQEEYEGLDLRMIARGLIQSLRVETIPMKAPKGRPSPVTNLYVTPFTKNVEDWRVVRSYLQALDYSETDYGQNIKVVEKIKCNGCHADDHPRGLCPFPKIPGWKGQQAAPSTEADDAVNMYTTVGPATNEHTHEDAGRGRGSRRGRGRGRAPTRGRGNRGRS